MIIFRAIAISLPQLLIFLYAGAKFDLLFGLNRTDYGFTILLFLFVLAPVINMSWLIAEIIISIRIAKRQNRAMSFLMPGLAFLFFIETAIIDILLLSQAKM